MHVVLLRAFRQCLVSLEGGNRHLRLERDRVVQLFPSYNAYVNAPCDGSHAAVAWAKLSFILLSDFSGTALWLAGWGALYDAFLKHPAKI
jgi:hypothetical protein